MSPAWIHNKLEQFNGIGKMIRHWEERKEEEEEGKESNGSGRERGRRSSHRMRQLVEMFEEGGGGKMSDQDSQLEGRVRVSSSCILHSISSSSLSPQDEKHSPSSSISNIQKREFINTCVMKQVMIDEIKNQQCDWPKVPTNENFNSKRRYGDLKAYEISG